MISIEYLNNRRIYNRVLKKINKDYIKYFKMYRFVHSKKRSSKKIMNIQYEINELINLYLNLIRNMKLEDHIKITYNEYIIDTNFIIIKYSDLIELYKLLIDDLIIKYCCSDNCMIFNQLIDNYQVNSNYNYENIKYYLEIVKKDYINRHTYCIVCDMSKFNLKCGDVVMFSTKTGFNYKEIKTGEHSKKIVDFVLNDKIEELHDNNYKEAKRIKKQLNKHSDLDSIIGFPITEDGFRFPEDAQNEKTFLKMIKNDLKKIHNQLYIEREVDKCIKYLIVNNILSNDSLNNKLSEYKCNGIDIFTYNEFMRDSSVHRPYLLKWNKREYIDLLMNNITIYIKIDSIKFLNLLKEKIENLSFEKALPEDYKDKLTLIIKGKKIIILKKNEQKIVLGKMPFYRIASLFYMASFSINKFVNDLNLINFEKLEDYE